MGGKSGEIKVEMIRRSIAKANRTVLPVAPINIFMDGREKTIINVAAY